MSCDSYNINPDFKQNTTIDMGTKIMLPADYNSGFDRKSTAEGVTKGVDLTGKTILITGVGSGLGHESMRVLSLRGAHVLGVDRNQDIADAACAKIDGPITAYGCDLSDPKAIVAFTKQIKKDHKKIDVLLANAGIMSPPHTVIEGYNEPLEIQFGVNFMANFLLVNHLLPLVKAADGGRFALVASDGYQSAPRKIGINFDDLDSSEGYSALGTYGQSKLAVVLFNKLLAEKLENSSVTTNAIHPGVIRTNLASDTKSFSVKLISAFAGPWTRTISQGAATHCYVAVHPDLDGISGVYFGDSNPKDLKPFAEDMKMARRLWEKAEELAADYLEPWSFN